MLREVVQIVEAHRDPIFKYIPKKLGKRLDKRMSEIELWVEAMKYPWDADYFGHYGKDKGLLEFNVKESLDFDYDEALDMIGGDAELLNYRIEDYYNMGREDLEETLRSEFGMGDFEYAGRQGGYLLVGDYDDAIFGGTGIKEVSVWYDDNYGTVVDAVLEIYDDLESMISDLTEEGPMGERFEEYLEDIENILDDSENYDISVKKGATNIIGKNYLKIVKRIEQITDGFGSGFMDYLTDMVEANR